MKNKITYLLFILLSFSVGLNAQQGSNRGKDQERHFKFNIEEFKQKKAAFLIKEVGLTDNEAKAFIPLTEELMKKKFELNKNIRQERRELKSKNTSTSAEEYERHIDNVLNTQIKEAELEKEYYQKYKKIISPEKLYKYYVAEKNFVKKFVNIQKNDKK